MENAVKIRLEGVELLEERDWERVEGMEMVLIASTSLAGAARISRDQSAMHDSRLRYWH